MIVILKNTIDRFTGELLSSEISDEVVDMTLEEYVTPMAEVIMKDPKFLKRMGLNPSDYEEDSCES